MDASVVNESGEGVESSIDRAGGALDDTFDTKWLSYLNLKSFFKLERNVGFSTLSLERRRHLNRETTLSGSDSSSDITLLAFLSRNLDILCEA